ncbi:MAG: baseplate J/gp47 family protein [Fibrobacterota bacterium]
MNPDFSKSHDQIFNEVLVSYRGASPNADTSDGSELYVRAAGIASCRWGLIQLLRWIYNQMFISTADQSTLERYGAEFDVTKSELETWEQYLARLTSVYRNQSGGGNATDVERWALDVTVLVDDVQQRASTCKCYPAKYGPGTSVILVSVASGMPSQQLLDRIVEVVIDKGPVVPSEVYATVANTKTITLSILMSGGRQSDASTAILAYIGSLQIGEAFQPVIVQSICMQAGALALPSVTPSAPVSAGPFERIVLSGAITWA